MEKYNFKDNLIIGLLSLLTTAMLGLGVSHISVLQDVNTNTNKMMRNEREIELIKENTKIELKEMNYKLNDIDKKLQVLIEKSK